MTLTKAIHISIITCVLLWVGLVMMPESLQSAIFGFWLITLPLAGWVLAVAARRTAISRVKLWSWALALVLLPAASISCALALQMDISPLTGPLYSGPLTSILPLAIIVATLWPAMLIVLLYLFKWTITSWGGVEVRSQADPISQKNAAHYCL